MGHQPALQPIVMTVPVVALERPVLPHSGRHLDPVGRRRCCCTIERAQHVALVQLPAGAQDQDLLADLGRMLDKDLSCSRQEISFHDLMEVDDLDISLVRSDMAAGIDRYLEHMDEGCSLDTTDLRRRIEQAVSKRHSYADLISKDTWGSAWNKHAEALFDLIVCE